MRLASEAVARIDSYVELLCLEAVDRAVVEYFDVSVGWVQQQQQLEQQQPEQQQQLELQQLVQRQRERLNTQCASELGGIAAGVGGYYARYPAVVALSCMCALGSCVSSCVLWMSTRT